MVTRRVETSLKKRKWTPFFPNFIMVSTGKEIMPSGVSDLYKHYRELPPHLDTQIHTAIYTPWLRPGK